MPQVFKFGRLFFPDKPNKKPIPDEVRFQPLGNHVGNVIELVRYWQKRDFNNHGSFERVVESAKIHDTGKPKHFAIQSKCDIEGNFKEYIYSFKGHRFDARSKDVWAQKLAIGHHDFSVKDIVRDAYELKKDPTYRNILSQDPLAYARELYILEMCDQIEAELACRVLGDDDQAESRAFMDFTIAKKDKETYLIDPWPFTESSISMTFKHWSMNPHEIDRDEELRQCIDRRNSKQPADLGKTLDRLAKKWWRELEETPKEAEPKTISLQPYPSNKESKSWTAVEFYDRLAGFKPNSMQSKVFDRIYDPDSSKHPAILLKGDTGTGKTEAILFPALASGNKIIFPLPAKSLLEDQKQRIEEYLKKFSLLHPGREFSMVVDTGSQMHRWIYQDGQEVKRGINSRRHLYKGDVILTTIDKFLYRYFAFGDKQKSFIFPLRIDREKTLICFDEAHSYDDISFTNFQSLVKSLYEAGRSLVLMTATMPPQLAEYFDYLEVLDCTGIVQPYERSFKWLNTIPCYEENVEGQKDFTKFQTKVREIALEEWQIRPDRRILVVVETVRDAAAIYQQLKKQLGGNTDESGQFLFLYHGRIDDGLRSNLYRSIKDRDEKKQHYIIITTRAIEVGCDLNAEVLISQICPPENLIQRVGRCNRRGDVKNAKVIVIGDRIPDFANSLDESGWEHYQKTLQDLNKFDSQAIAECIFPRQHIDDYRVVEIFSMLHDYVYGADLTCQSTHEKGLIPTRSWQPSVTLKFHGKPQNSHEAVEHSISVPIDRLCGGNNLYAFVSVNERRYDKETAKWNDNYPLGWGSAYDKDIIINISSNLSEFIFDATLPEYPYEPELGFVNLPSIFIKLKTNGAEEKLLHQYTDKNQQKKSAIVTYTKSLDK